eukprot:jgi/Tetstr1/461322/TSEL_006449.t1
MPRGKARSCGKKSAFDVCDGPSGHLTVQGLMEATDGAIGEPAYLIMDIGIDGIDGIQLTKFKHQSATVYVTRVAIVPR